MTVGASPKLGAYAACAGVGLLAALTLQRPEALLFAVPFLLVLTIGLATAEPPDLQVGASLIRDRVLEGEETALALWLTADRAIERLEILPRLPAGVAATDRARVLTIRLEPGARRHVPYTIRTQEWGGYVLGDVLFRGQDRFGLFIYSSRVTPRLPLRVYPRLERLDRAPRPLRTRAMAGNQVAHRSGEGIEFAEVRPFVPGDRLRRVNWRAAARSGKLSVNQQHAEQNADIVLFLDSFVEAGTKTGVLTMAVRAAAALAQHYLDARDRVGLVGFGGNMRWLSPASGAIQRYRIVEALLDTQIVLTYAWKEITVLPMRAVPPGALVVALSPLLDERSTAALLALPARGVEIVVIEVSPEPFVARPTGAGPQLAHRLWLLQREAQRQRLRRLGIPLATWQPARPLEAVLEEVQTFQRSKRHRRA